MEETINKIYQLAKQKMQEQGAFDRDAYKNFVEETHGVSEALKPDNRLPSDAFMNSRRRCHT